MTEDDKNDQTEEAPTGEAAEEQSEGAPSAEDPTPVEPEAPLAPKERRHRARATGGEARPPRSLEERLAERAAKRAANAAERRRWRTRSREKRRQGGPREGTPVAERRGTGSPRVRQGMVVSDKADKTIVVKIDLARQHRTYGKIVRTSTKLHAHDERNEAATGDTVRVVESRPLSATKRWRLIEILDRAR
jgi:small subunit ribosomal protein S17